MSETRGMSEAVMKDSKAALQSMQAVQQIYKTGKNWFLLDPSALAGFRGAGRAHILLGGRNWPSQFLVAGGSFHHVYAR